AVAGLEPRRIALPRKLAAQLIAERAAVGGEPVVGEGERAGKIERPPMRFGIDAGTECVAPPAAERLRQIPVGAAAGQTEAESDVRRSAIVVAGGKPVVAGRDIVGAEHGIAFGQARAAERRAPGAPALIEA